MHGGKPGVEIRLEWSFCPNGAVKLEPCTFRMQVGRWERFGTWIVPYATGLGSGNTTSVRVAVDGSQSSLHHMGLRLPASWDLLNV